MSVRCGSIKADLSTLGSEATPKIASACWTEAGWLPAIKKILDEPEVLVRNAAAVSWRKRWLAVLHRRGVKSRAREPALYYLCHSEMSLSWPVTRLLTATACTVD